MNFDIDKMTDLLNEKLVNWGEMIIKLLPNIVIAAIVLVIGLYIAKFVKKITLKLVSKISNNVTLNNLFSSVVYFAFIGIVLFTVLSILNLFRKNYLLVN